MVANSLATFDYCNIVARLFLSAPVCETLHGCNFAEDLIVDFSVFGKIQHRAGLEGQNAGFHR